MNIRKITTAALLAAALTLTTAASCDDIEPVQPAPVEAVDGDCDEGDKYESVPDPDCNGVWYGTPRPIASTRKTSGPAPRNTRRR